LRFDVLTLFPDLIGVFRSTGVLGRAVERGLVELETHDLRRWAGNRWGQVDDEPYGGGAGMVIQAPPVLRAVRELRDLSEDPGRLVMLTPRGRVFDQELARELATEDRLVLLCGRYEGFDERVNEILQPQELSIGDYILGGGEVAAMAVMEAVARLLPGVVGDPLSVSEDSFTEGLLDYPAYTRPAEVEGHGIPEILVSGHHERIRRWRLEESVRITVERRPGLVLCNWNRYPAEVRALIRRFAPALAARCEEPEGPATSETR